MLLARHPKTTFSLLLFLTNGTLKSEFEIVIGDKAKLKMDKALKRDSAPETIIEK